MKVLKITTQMHDTWSTLRRIHEFLGKRIKVTMHLTEPHNRGKSGMGGGLGNHLKEYFDKQNFGWLTRPTKNVYTFVV